MKLLRPFILPALLLSSLPSIAAPKNAPSPSPAAPSTPLPNPLETTPQGQTLLKTWQQEGHVWTPKVRAAYLAFAKAQTLKEIASAGQAADFPADFLEFVDKDPQVALTIYGFQPTDAANRLRLLRSLELDLGKETVRGDKYCQLALAMVAVRGNTEGSKADLKQRAPMKFEIPVDPRVIVDTKPKDRPLDVNDHIINFLNDHAPIPDDGSTRRVVWPELAYDENGKAIDSDKVQPQEIAPDESAKDGAPAPQKMRRLYASDVIASAELEKEFNDYMAAHGQTARVQCGAADGRRLNWRSNEVKGVNSSGITAAYNLFLTAYRAKGYFPAKPDAAPTAAESLAYYRMIGDYVAPSEAKVKGARFDFTRAPWPILVYLAQDTQPLRERDDMWQRWIKNGEFHGYGEYTGGIAQVPVLQMARRLTPYAFDNNSAQMMIKDGGVCGTMAGLNVKNSLCLGAPASTANQPGHCALVAYRSGKDGTYNLSGDLYATGGDRSTTPHRPFIFGGGAARQMYAHQSVAFAVNAGRESFLDTLAARSFHQSLPADARAANGQKLLISAIALNPYNLAVNEVALAEANTPVQLAAVGKALYDSFANLKDKPGCPPNSLMREALNNNLYAKLEKMPVPATAAEAATVLAFLRGNESPNLKLNINYLLAAEGEAGIKPMLEKLKADFAVHATRRLPGGPAMPNQCLAMAVRVTGVVESNCPDAIKQPCLDALRELIKGHENYTYRKIVSGHMVYTVVDPSAIALAKAAVDYKIARNGLPAFITETEAAFKNHVISSRTDASCAIMTDTLATILGQLTDKKKSQAWAAARLKEIEGHEKFVNGSGAFRNVAIDTTVPLLAKHAGVKTRPDKEMTQSLLEELRTDLKKHVESKQSLQVLGELASRLKSASAAIKEPELKNAWFESLTAIIRNKKSVGTTVPNTQPQTPRDPLADGIIAQEIRAAGTSGNQAAFTMWTALADKFLPPVVPGDVFLNPQQVAAHPKIEPFSGTLLSPEALLLASSASKHDRPLSYKNVLSPGIGGWLHTNMEAKPWLQVELPGDSELSGIVLVGRYEHPKDNPSRTGALPMKVQTSTDGKTWTDVATLETVQDVYRVDLESRKTKARYVRVERAQSIKQPAADLEFRNVLIYGRKS